MLFNAYSVLASLFKSGFLVIPDFCHIILALSQPVGVCVCVCVSMGVLCLFIVVWCTLWEQHRSQNCDNEGTTDTS